MADEKHLDSYESADDVVVPEVDRYDADGIDEPLVVSDGDDALEDGRTLVSEGEDQPGENLASDLLPDDTAPYVVASSEHEAEELVESDFMADEAVSDAGQLVEAEAVAAVAASTRPMKRKQKRALAEADLVDAEPEPVVAAPASLRPQRKSAVVAKKDHATPKQTPVTREEHHRVGPAQFVRESADELRKVVWPTGAQLWQYFVIVLVFVLFIIAFVSLLDYAFGWLLLKLFG